MKNHLGLSKDDVRRIQRLAEATTLNHQPAALDDLSVAYRVGAMMPDTERWSSGQKLGTWAGRVLLYWRMDEREVAAWRARRRG